MAVHRAEDYWQPPKGSQTETPAQALACPECGTEFVVGSRFCHVCGAEREAPRGRSAGIAERLQLTRIRDSVGLSVAPLLCLVAGFACVLAAIGTGLIYSANTVLDWQAVQVWRIEWLLSALVVFAAGILLKRNDSH